MNELAFKALIALLIITGIVAVGLSGYAAYESAFLNDKVEVAEQPQIDKSLEDQIKKIVNESIRCFELPEEEMKPEGQKPEAKPTPSNSYVYYVSYFYDGNQGGAEVSMTREITCWADLYTAADSVAAQIKAVSKDLKSIVIIQYSLLRSTVVN